MLKPSRAKQTPNVIIFHWIAISLSLLLFASSNFSAQNSSQASVIQEFQEARAAEQQGQYAAALTHYQHLLKLNPRLAQVYSNMGLDYYRLNRYPQAAESLKNALKLQPDLLGAQVMLGFTEFKLGQFKSSLLHLKKALKFQPTNREVDLFLIQDQMALDRFDLAFAQQTLQRFPKDAELNYIIGLAALERLRDIAHHANSLGERSPVFQWISLRQDEQQQNLQGAKKHLEILKKFGVTNTPPPLVREYDTLTSLVKECFTTVLESSPDSKYAHSVRGYMDESQGHVTEALAEYRKAGDHFAAGRLLAQNFRLSEAAEELRTAVDADPENRLALAELAQVYVQEHRPDAALPILRNILTEYPNDAEAWADFGKAQISLNEITEGIRSLQTALKLDPTQASLHYELAMAYRKVGDTNRATQEIQKFRQASLKNR